MVRRWMHAPMLAAYQSQMTSMQLMHSRSVPSLCCAAEIIALMTSGEADNKVNLCSGVVAELAKLKKLSRARLEQPGLEMSLPSLLRVKIDKALTYKAIR